MNLKARMKKMNRSLYEINQDYLNLINSSFSIDEETGEILFDEEKLNAINDEFENKVDNIVSLVKEKKALVEARKKEIEALKERNERDLKVIDNLQNYVLSSMTLRDRKKVETARNSVTYRISKSVNIFNEALVPSQFIKEEIKTSIDKKAIMESLKNGETVDGCAILEKKNISIK